MSCKRPNPHKAAVLRDLTRLEDDVRKRSESIGYRVMDFDGAIQRGLAELDEFLQDWLRRNRDYVNEVGDNWG